MLDAVNANEFFGGINPVENAVVADAEFAESRQVLRHADEPATMVNASRMLRPGADVGCRPERHERWPFDNFLTSLFRLLIISPGSAVAYCCKPKMPVMKTNKILFPLDLAKCPLDAFSLVNDFAARPHATLILLHVVNLNILAPENRVYEELCQEAEWRLQQLAAHYVQPTVETRLRVRVGNPSEEIMAEAAEQQVNLIVLPLPRPSFWKRLLAPILPRATGKLMENTPCPVFALPVKNWVNCEEHWNLGREVRAPQGNRPARKSPVMASTRRHAELCAGKV